MDLRETDEFDEITKRDAAARRAQDRADLNNEQSGRETGRIARHLAGKAAADDPNDPKRKRAKAVQSLLEQLLLSDPVYAAAYRRANTFLSHAERVTETAMTLARSALATAEAEHADLLDRANRLPDGTRVFRAEDGRVYDEAGQVVSDAAAASVVWKPGSPSYEHYRQSRKAVEEARGALEELQIYQVDVLGQWRNRIEDSEAPPSRDELDQLMEDIRSKAPEAIKPQLEAGWAAAVAAPPSGTADPDPAPGAPEPSPRSTSIDIPKL